MTDSIFTRIIKGEIPCHKIYEDDSIIAFLDIKGTAAGHTLVVPKQQIEQIWDMDEESYQALLLAAKKIALHLRETLPSRRVGVKVIGESVPHVHIHLIPYQAVDEYLNSPDESREPDHAKLADLAKKLAF